MQNMQGIIGLLFLFCMALFASEQRRDIRWRPIIVGFFLQFFLAILLLKVPASRHVFVILNQIVLALEKATISGTTVVFGYLGGGQLPFEEISKGSSFILAFKSLPVVLLVSALSSLLFYLGILPLIVKTGSRLLSRSMGVGGALGISSAANVFVGMVEAPLLIRPYLLKMSRGELFAVMTCGMSTVAGTVLVLYASILQSSLPDALGHILTASLISAPAALSVALILVPHTGDQTTGELVPPNLAHGTVDAIVLGTLDGLKLLLNIVAMLIVFVALVGLVNQVFSYLPMLDGAPLTLQRILGWFFAPIAWTLGIHWQECAAVGSLLGTKTILNEFIAYLDLANMGPDVLSDRSRLIATYALCGFANFGSLGIMLGGLSAMIPERRKEIVGLGLKSILSGTMATCLTGTVVGIIL
ncbi:MAG: nucleoside:proton symporter [Deltaproteobacteria bacterium]|jgi:CNT family concentrative nucleoside transporter|nr:nucleoside:proton symporter [Deltaproteobacteria bacterium]MBW2520832.1 nucleoside:proton symporter [Deltaproteobacteria bacterium]